MLSDSGFILVFSVFKVFGSSLHWRELPRPRHRPQQWCPPQMARPRHRPSPLPAGPFLPYRSEEQLVLSNGSGGVIPKTKAKGPQNRSLPCLPTWGSWGMLSALHCPHRTCLPGSMQSSPHLTAYILLSVG